MSRTRVRLDHRGYEGMVCHVRSSFTVMDESVTPIAARRVDERQMTFGRGHERNCLTDAMPGRFRNGGRRVSNGDVEVTNRIPGHAANAPPCVRFAEPFGCGRYRRGAARACVRSEGAFATPAALPGRAHGTTRIPARTLPCLQRPGVHCSDRHARRCRKR
jgi:hypothetical protein